MITTEFLNDLLSPDTSIRTRAEAQWTLHPTTTSQQRCRGYLQYLQSQLGRMTTESDIIMICTNQHEDAWQYLQFVAVLLRRDIIQLVAEFPVTSRVMVGDELSIVNR